MVAGLGNPGKIYAGNRHNTGWMAVDAICSKYKVEPVLWKGICFKCPVKIENQQILLALPTTYMNNSGEAVLKLSKEYNISVENIIIICDEYNFPLGKIHLKRGGSDGGHNGVNSVIQELGTDNFLRLRCGIGKNFPQGGMVDYVLSNFTNEEIPERDSMLKKVVDAIVTFFRLGEARAHPLINSGSLWREQSDEK